MVFKKSLDKLKAGLRKTREILTTDIGELIRGRRLDDNLLEKLEENFITADVGVETTMRIIEDLRAGYQNKEIRHENEILDFLKASLKKGLMQGGNEMLMAPTPPTVILVAGVNGSGKTTSIAKLARFYSLQGQKVLLAASDTFRAAAVAQIEQWAKRLDVGIVKHQMGADPAAVAFDAAQAALARKVDILIVDTAGRLHTQKNLMQELAKIHRVLGKKIPGAPHEVILVLDATTGQNAISQARNFKEVINVTGLFLAKLDGTAKGGVVIAIQHQVNIPVKFVGIGEKPDDIEKFNAANFVDALLS